MHSDRELLQIEKDMESELEPLLKNIEDADVKSRECNLFKRTYANFETKHKGSRDARDYLHKGILAKSHNVKDTIQWMLAYLGLVESLGNIMADTLVFLLVANGIDFHIESRHSTPRIRHALNPEELEKEQVSLATKLNFLKQNGIEKTALVINTKLRNDIAHMNIKVKGNVVLIRGQPAKEKTFDNSLRLLHAFNKMREMLEASANKKGIRKQHEDQT
jgi:hypothetical protein